MALFGFGKDKRDPAQLDTALAYLEDLQRSRSVISVVDSRKKQVGAVVGNLDETNGEVTLQLQGPLVGSAKGDLVEVIFISEGTRIGASTRVVDVRGNTLVLDVPETLEIRERRKDPRGRLLAKEAAGLTALTSLFEGVGLTGAIENLSENGARIRVEKAMSIQGEKKLPLGQALVPVGQPFMVVKLNQVPKCPATLELAGKAVYLEQAPGGLFMGIRFDKPQTALRPFLSQRATSQPRQVPPKSRRKNKPVETEERQASPPSPAPPPAAPPPEAASSSAPTQPAPGGQVPNQPSGEPQPSSPQPGPSTPVPTVRQAPSPVLRLKKRSRAVVVLASEGRARELQAALENDGYGRVLTTSDLESLANYLDEPNLGLLLLDPEESFLGTLQLLRNLHTAKEHLPPVVIATQEVSKATVVAASRAGARQVIVKPYALDDGFFGMLESLLE